VSKRYQSTVVFDKSIYIHSWASIVGKKEHDGPLGECFDEFSDDEFFGQESFEKAESYLQQNTVGSAIKKGGLYATDIDVIFGSNDANYDNGASRLEKIGLDMI
jgi:stage V sporulation protein AD